MVRTRMKISMVVGLRNLKFVMNSVPTAATRICSVVINTFQLGNRGDATNRTGSTIAMEVMGRP